MLEEKILELISLHREGDYWDFKKQWHSNNSDLLHDIICMSNNLTSSNAYIIIGIDEENDYSICDVVNDPNRKQTQDIICFLRDKKFAGDIRPTVYVQSLCINKYTIDIIVIQNDCNTPYYLTKDALGIHANNIYTRIMDTNTPKNSSADINVVEKLWMKRFGIDKTPLECVNIYLRNPNNWVSNDVGKKFYKFAPEFTIEKVSASEERTGYEFYLFNQTDSRPHWYDINIYYHQTMLYSLGGAGLDGNRCFTSTPLTNGIRLSPQSFHWDISYKYFIKNSIEYIVHQFYITDDIDEELTARCRFLKCVLVFENEVEMKDFNEFVIEKYKEYNPNDFKNRLPYFPNLDGYIMDAFKEDFLNALLLNKMLDDFRQQ